MKNHTLFYGSSYDRGLDVLLTLWPRILRQFPDATLHICYGWDLFDKVAVNNKERQAWKRDVVEAMKQPGIIHHGRVGKSELKRIRKECGIWAYPTYFTEINSITALDCQKDGLVPVTMTLAALNETVQSGFKIKGDIKKEDVQEAWLQALFKVMGDNKLFEEESAKAKKWAKKFYWNKIADKWISEFKKPLSEPLVTIYTPTVREGWWNLMSNNIAVQTYKNIEWIIVDDHKQNRSEIAKKYAKKYGLNIRYVKGKKRKVKRTYSLINANNTALELAKGAIFVFLQDFVLMPNDGIEKIVEVYRHHPNDFIAPVDVYYSPKVKPNTNNSEDWFDGEIDVMGEFMRKNVRIQNKGFRESRTITDFEQNYGAVATQVLRGLGGYYEFFDEALGFDDTEIIYRAFLKKHRLFIDEGNIGVCIDHWGVLGKDEGGKSVNRTRRLNDPRFSWLIRHINNKKLPIIRTQEIDDQIDLQYTIPEEITDDKCVDWVRNNVDNIVESWHGQIPKKVSGSPKKKS